MLLRRGLLRTWSKKGPRKKKTNVGWWGKKVKKSESEIPAEMVSPSRQEKEIPNYFRLADLSHVPSCVEFAVRYTLVLLFLFLYVGSIGYVSYE